MTDDLFLKHPLISKARAIGYFCTHTFLRFNYECTPIHSISGKSLVSMAAYSNPATDNIMIQLPEPMSSMYRLITSNGQVVRSGRISNQSIISLNLVGIESDNYLF